ncbi:hypothetical protein [Mucilaginibacter sp.]
MKDYTTDQQSRIYLYDLVNTAQEHGFKADDHWEISLVADQQKAEIQRQYYPAIVTRMLPETILDVFYSIKLKLNQHLSKMEEEMDIRSVIKADLRFLVAYNLKRPRT